MAFDEVKNYFDVNGYVVLSGTITNDRAQFLTKHMFDLYEKGDLVRDSQCPQSDAVYGDPHMEELLESMAGPIGAQVGKRLLPTYAYARIYRPGEILKKHKDRPACEISATLTLGFDGKNVWPIFFQDDDGHEIPVQLEVGEMAVYKGCEMLHWREPFKGKWHVQVFLHYVDADGPYADQARDGRPEKTVEQKSQVVKQTQTQQPNKMNVRVARPLYDTVFIPGNDDTLPGYFGINSSHMPELMFTKQECERIIALTEEAYSANASVGGGDKGRIAKEIRSADIFVLENDNENRWIYEKIANAVSIANSTHYDYEIAGIVHGLQLIKYSANGEVQGHYDWHVDAGRGHVATRKISVTIQLSDPNTYDGCDLIVNDHCNVFEATREQGAINMFPSYMPHQVTPVTKGERYALVVWVHGSRRFR